MMPILDPLFDPCGHVSKVRPEDDRPYLCTEKVGEKNFKELEEVGRGLVFLILWCRPYDISILAK